MACRWTELSIDARDPGALARFWAEALGYAVGEEDEGGVELKRPHAAAPAIVFAPVPEEKTVKNRLHIDVNATDRSRDEEVERLLALGATKVDVGQRDVTWVVLADPEGNEFCVLQRKVSDDLDIAP